MSKGKIVFISQNVWSKKKCNQCQVQLEEKQPRFMHMPIQFPCSFVECLRCCFTRACQYEKCPQKCYFRCCIKPHPSFWKQLTEILNSNCIICGKYCRSEKILIGEENVKFLVGKECYKNLLSNQSNRFFKGLTALQKNVCNEIKKYAKFACQICPQKLQGDIILASEKQLQLKICPKCYHLSIEEQKKWKKIYKNCSQCEQPQIYQQLGTLGVFGKKSTFTLVQIYKNWDEKNPKFRYCSFCIYLNYLNLEKQNSRIRKPHYDFIRLKAKYQRHFMDHCMVCSKKQEQSVYAFPIISPNTQMSIFSYICINCHNIKNTQKYSCLKFLRNFFQQTKQNDLGEINAMTIKKFKSNAKLLLDDLLKKKYELKEVVSKDPFWATNDNQQKQRITQRKKQNKFEQGEYEEEAINQSRKTQLITDPDQERIFYRNCRNQQQISVIDPQTNAMEQIFQIKLENLQFRPVKTQKNAFDIGKWQKSLIEEFKNISQKEKNLQLKNSKTFKICEEEKWRPRQIISEPENFIKQQQCLMYKKCRMTQKYLNIERLCKMCFVKYLIGDRQIIDAVQRLRKPQMKEGGQQIRPNTSQEGKKNQKEKSMISSFLGWS